VSRKVGDVGHGLADSSRPALSGDTHHYEEGCKCREEMSLKTPPGACNPGGQEVRVQDCLKEVAHSHNITKN
jgi:hypothetical protein